MLNPITYTEQVVSDFLRYQLSTYAFADQGLYQQMRALLNLEHTRNTPLLKGPYISLSRIFREGASLEQLVQEDVLHPHITRNRRFAPSMPARPPWWLPVRAPARPSVFSFP
jgi:hypothetical protein